MAASPLEWLFKIVDRMTAPAKDMAKAVASVDKATAAAAKTTAAAEKAQGKNAAALNVTTTATKATTVATESLERTQQAANNATEKGALGLGKYAVAAGASVLALRSVVGVAMDLAKAIFNAAASAERLTYSFRIRKGGADLLSYLDKVAESTEFTRTQLRQIVAPLVNKGFGVDSLKTMLPAALDVAARNGTGEAGTRAALEALAKIRTNKTIDRSTLDALGLDTPQTLVPVLKMLRAQGKVAGTSDRMLEKGLTSPDELLSFLSERMTRGRTSPEKVINTLLAALTKQGGGEIGNNAIDASKSLEALVNKITSLPQTIFENVAGSAVFPRIKASVERVLEALSRPETIERMTKAVDAFVTGLVWLAEFLGRNTWILAAFGVAIGGVAAVLLVLGAAAGVVVAALGAVAFTILKTIDAVIQAVKWFVNLQSTMVQVGADLVSGFVKGIVGGIGKIGDAVMSLGTAAVDGLKKALGIQSPSKAFAELGRYSAEGFVQGFDRSMGGVGSMMEAAIPMDGIAGGSRFAPASGGAFMAGGVVVNVTVNAETNASPEQIGERIRDILPGALVSAFDQLATAHGLAT